MMQGAERRQARLIATALLLVTAVGAVKAEPSGGLKLWYSRPAAKWLEASPVGNGSLGGMIFGGPTNERVQFNEQTRWLGQENTQGD